MGLLLTVTFPACSAQARQYETEFRLETIKTILKQILPYVFLLSGAILNLPLMVHLREKI